MQDEYSITELAELFAVDRSTIWRDVQNGEFGKPGQGYRRKTTAAKSPIVVFQSAVIRYAQKIGKPLPLE